MNKPNDKRFTVKMLGIFLMETLNITPKEIRKTFWHIIGGLAVLLAVWRLPDLLAVLLK